MIITTTYTQTLTITTDDAGHITTTRTAIADTVSACLFDELTPEAQQRAIRDAIEEEDREYCESGIYGASQTGMSEAEIIDAARDLERQQPVDIRQDYGCSWYGTARRYGWSAADWQSVTEQADTGICWSMDLCDVWNEYARRIIVLQEGYEEATDEAWRLEEEADRLDDARHFDDMPDAMRDALRSTEEGLRAAAAEYERICERIEAAAEEITEEAARAVGNTVDSLIEGERDYYQSADFWHDWLDDGETRFARDGMRI